MRALEIDTNNSASPFAEERQHENKHIMLEQKRRINQHWGALSKLKVIIRAQPPKPQGTQTHSIDLAIAHGYHLCFACAEAPCCCG